MEEVLETKRLVTVFQFDACERDRDDLSHLHIESL